MPRLFAFGLGYTARRLAAALLREGWAVAGTVRDPARIPGLAAAGVTACRFGPDQPLDDAASVLAGTTHLLISVPPDRDGDPAGPDAPGIDPVIAAHGGAVAALPGLAWIGYLSATGVYGDREGGRVDEATPPAPTSARGRRRLAAERAWAGLGRSGGPAPHLFRLAGIYGPGRSALDAVRAGRAQRVDAPGSVMNRIHVDDIVQALRASIARPSPGPCNLADDEPAPSAEVVAFACRLLGAPVPDLVPLDAASLSPMARGFYAERKRVANDRMKRDLGVRLLYPSYREGLAAILAEERRAGHAPAP